jgi:hypothetical protein
MMKEMVEQDVAEPMKNVERNAESGAFRQTFKYESYGCATEFKQRNSSICQKRLELRKNDWIGPPDSAPAHKVSCTRGSRCPLLCHALSSTD